MDGPVLGQHAPNAPARNWMQTLRKLSLSAVNDLDLARASAFSPRPAIGGQFGPIGTFHLHCVIPGDCERTLHLYRHEHPAAKTSTAGAEAFLAVDRGILHCKISAILKVRCNVLTVEHIQITETHRTNAYESIQSASLVTFQQRMGLGKQPIQ